MPYPMKKTSPSCSNGGRVTAIREKWVSPVGAFQALMLDALWHRRNHDFG
jgi:hypothetical protein